MDRTLTLHRLACHCAEAEKSSFRGLSVFERSLRALRRSVQEGTYLITVHGTDEMEQDGLTMIDLETCILTGSIVERQRDQRTGEHKYVVEGEASGGERMAVVAKLRPGGTMAILTVFRIWP